MKAYILIAILFLTSCTSKKEEKPITPKKKTQKTIQVVKEPQAVTTEIIETFTDSLHIGKKKNCKIEIIKYSISDQNYVTIKFYTKKFHSWHIQNTYVYECDALMDLQPDISDFNNDKLNDITFISATAARGANEVRRLFIYDKQNKQLISILNSQDFPNMQYNAELDCIDAWLFHGGTTTVFAKIEKDSLKQFASVDCEENITVREIDKFGRDRIIRKDSITSFKDRDAFVRYKNYKPLKEY